MKFGFSGEHQNTLGDKLLSALGAIPNGMSVTMTVAITKHPQTGLMEGWLEIVDGEPSKNESGRNVVRW